MAMIAFKPTAESAKMVICSYEYRDTHTMLSVSGTSCGAKWNHPEIAPKAFYPARGVKPSRKPEG